MIVMMTGHQGSEEQKRRKMLKYNVMLLMINNCDIFFKPNIFMPVFIQGL